MTKKNTRKMQRNFVQNRTATKWQSAMIGVQTGSLSLYLFNTLIGYVMDYNRDGNAYTPTRGKQTYLV